MRRADRLFQIVQLLRNRRFVTAQLLADELEVSVRTVYRDVRDLQRSGVPIIGEAGVGYQLSRGYELPALTFNAEEVEALVLGLRVVETWGDRDLGAAARGAMQKIESVLPAPLREVLLRTHIYAPRHRRAELMTSGPLGDLRKAVADQRKVQIDYTRADGTDSNRVIWPLGLHFWGGTWSIAAWCDLRQDYRTFRPDRIEALTALDETFGDQDAITLEGYLDTMAARDGRTRG